MEIESAKPFVGARLLECVHSLLATPIRRRRAEERRTEKVEYNGKPYAVTGGGQQILSLMRSVYGNSLARNHDLMHIQTQLNLLNDNLNEQVRERTAELRQVLEETITAALGMDAALNTLTQGRGTQFDPAVVDACLLVVKKPGYGATG